ncbi:MAG: ATP-binding protein [Verrucomicrobiota bacterium]
MGHPENWHLRLFGLLATLAFVAPVGSVGAQETPGIVRFFSKSVRDLENRLEEIEQEQELLPSIPFGPKGGSLGFHSWPAVGSGEREASLLIDLGRSRPIEAIVLVPAHLPYGDGTGRGYGFPPEFEVGISDSKDFRQSSMAISHKRPINPFPAVVLETDGAQGRYVRVLASKFWTAEGSDRAVFALSELMVFSEGRNVAPMKRVVASTSMEVNPLWSARNLVDGQSSLGPAIQAERSETNGYHSQLESTPNVIKWVEIDLGSVQSIDEIRIYPARPRDWAESHGFGFPERFRIELAEKKSLAGSFVLLDRTKRAFPNPGDNPIILPVEGREARFIRFTATKLWPRDNSKNVFALGEMQVFSGGVNLAARAKVSASDSYEAGLWSRDSLVDGFDSQNRLETDELGWLKGIAKRQRLIEEASVLDEDLAEIVGRVSGAVIWLAGFLALTLFTVVWLIVRRHRILRRQETDRLRARIASDLHDEIGSNLGSIALLSQIGGGREEMGEINRIARETATSMHDIAWVIRSGHDNLQDLILRMREVAAAMLKPVDYSFEVRPNELPRQRITLDFKRNALLFFKEALHNIVRHASATEVSIVVDASNGRLSLSIEDDGDGFDQDDSAAKSGGGLKNLAMRARALGGEAVIESTPGEGAKIAFVGGRI